MSIELDEKPEKTQRLSIQLSLNGFSFLVTDKENNKPIVARSNKFITNDDKSLLDELKKQLHEEEVFKLLYEETVILLETDRYTLVPQAHFSEEQAANYYTLHYKLENDEEIRWDTVEEAVVLYAISNTLLHFLESQFPGCKIKNQISSFLQVPQKCLRNAELSYVGVHIADTFADICVVDKKGTIKLCNSFAYKTREDLLYFILYTIDNLELSLRESEIILQGKSDYLATVKEALAKYHPHVRLAAYSEGLQADEKLHQATFMNLYIS